MPYPRPFLRLQASGTLHGSEQWSWTLSLVPDTNDVDAIDAPEAVPAGVVAAVEAFHTGVGISSAARLNTVKLNAIAPNGRYASEGDTVYHDYGQPGVSGAGAAKYPPQVSLAISLMTEQSRGLASKGRFYIPSPVLDLQSDGRISANDAALVAGVATTFVQALNAAVVGFSVGVASDVRTGALRRVTEVRVGRALDTIRSRRGKFREEYALGGGIDAA